MKLPDARTRTLLAFGSGAVAAVLVAGVLTIGDSSSEDLTARLASDRTVQEAPAGSTDLEIPAGDAGVVTINSTGELLSLLQAAANDGWTVSRQRQEPGRVRVEFRRDGERVRVEIRLKDGNLETRVQSRDEPLTAGDDDGTPDRGSGDVTSSPTTATTIDDEGDDDATPTSTPTTIDDDDDDVTTATTIDDHGGDDRDDDRDDDHSGPGRGGDDDGDHSGHGGGGDD